ncbi:cyclopropane fatty acyl phospholipid synthase [Corynebacterium kalinowskii]|uniref:Cyclopropane fatty acyl phospholipid synthase n=1 Tax=Corynebacterium kalinowskii TaxID=2675216 RepID=A0A6B8VXD5_9CORY|nr:class I SAM-dependent methyltransferase [Corynebacterium kalinowskii]QGU01960.1 cyclopropane fatty acyl phospholipid synthase [Corynebacterium kalinowskii]
MATYIPQHLENVDAQSWPALVSVTEPGRIVNFRTRQAERRFAVACDKAGIALGGESPDVEVVQEELFVRLAESGWLGLAESYMAGEWTATDLTGTLTKLLGADFQPQGRRSGTSVRSASRGDGHELPADLVQLCSVDGVSMFGGLFASGVPTTVRTSTKSFVSGAGRGSEPATHFVDVTTLSAPIGVERADFDAAQQRAAESLLDAALVDQGADVLEFPSSGGTIALLASARGATVDVLTADPDHQIAVEEFITLNGATDYVHPYTLKAPFPTREEWRGRYDCIISTEKLEYLGKQGAISYLKSLDRMLTIGGFIGLQTVVATDSFGPTSRQALSVLRSYVWPALRFSTITGLHTLVDKESGLRIIAEKHFGDHYLESLRIQRELFESHLREAAAAGYDPVFRRMWIYHFALLEALFRLGHLEAVQLTLTTRNRSGRR